MGLMPPEILIKKFIPVLTAEGVYRAESELEALLRLAFPALSLKSWRRPTFNDLLEGGAGIELPPGQGREVVFCYFGTRRSLIGAYLFANLKIEKKELLNYRSCDLPFIRPMLGSISSLAGTVFVGQTKADLLSLGIVSGKKSDVFAYALGVSSGLARSFIRPGDEGKAVVFSVVDFACIASKAFVSDDVVSVPRWRFGIFLRTCFRELSGMMTRREFEERFGSSGVRWRPRYVLG